MQTVIRQDGSEVELSDVEAEKWINCGLAVAPPAAKPASPPSKKLAKEPINDEGASA
jgi:hypothetical protein